MPTTALFFLSRSSQPRFAFQRKNVQRIDGVSTWEIAFRETHRPTLVRTRAVADVQATYSSFKRFETSAKLVDPKASER